MGSRRGQAPDLHYAKPSLRSGASPCWSAQGESSTALGWETGFSVLLLQMVGAGGVGPLAGGERVVIVLGVWDGLFAGVAGVRDWFLGVLVGWLGGVSGVGGVVSGGWVGFVPGWGVLRC